MRAMPAARPSRCPLRRRTGRGTFRAVYERPYQMHASLAPSAALAHLDGRRADGPDPFAGALSAAGRDRRNASASIPYRCRSSTRPARGATGTTAPTTPRWRRRIVARAFPGRAVLLKWSREEEHAWEPYGPGDAHRDVRRISTTAGTSASLVARDIQRHPRDALRGPDAPGTPAGRFLAPRYRRRPGAPLRLRRPTSPRAAAFTATPRRRTRSRRRASSSTSCTTCRCGSPRSAPSAPMPTSLRPSPSWTSWRNVAGADPFDWRRRHLEDARTRAVLDAAAERFGWTAAAGARRPRRCRHRTGASRWPATRT